MRFIKLDENNEVNAIRYGSAKLEGEIISEFGEIGQIIKEDGTFITPEKEPIIPTATVADKINYIYYKLQGVL